MQKRTKILIAVSVLLAVLLLAAAGFLYYRTTPHYTLRHEHYADVTLDDGNIVRFIRHYEITHDGSIQIYNELDIYKIVELNSDKLVIPEKVGGFPVTSFGKHTPAAMFADVPEMQIKRLILPDTMKNIAAGGLYNLEFLDIGNSTADGLYRLDAYNLKEVKVSANNMRYKVENGCLFYKENGDLVFDYAID